MMTHHDEMMDMTPNYDAIDLRQRVDFQRVLIKLMLGENFKEKPREQQILLEIDWADTYAKKVSLLIDNPDNKEIRAMIFAHEYDKAAEFLKPILEAQRKESEEPIAA